MIDEHIEFIMCNHLAVQNLFRIQESTGSTLISLLKLQKQTLYSLYINWLRKQRVCSVSPFCCADVFALTNEKKRSIPHDDR